MHLKIKNIGKIREATIELNGIAVIGGENNTGKSTVSKILYSIINSTYKYHDNIIKNRVRNIDRNLFSISRQFSPKFIRYRDNIAKDIVDHADIYINDKKSLVSLLNKFVKTLDEENEIHVDYKMIIEQVADRIINSLKIPDEDVLMKIVSDYFNVEFNGQINNIFNEQTGLIELENDSTNSSFYIENDNVIKISDIKNSLGEAIYIDDPFVLGDDSLPRWGMSNSIGLDHKEHLRRKLNYNLGNDDIIDRILSEKKLDQIYSIINTVCIGNVIKEEHIGLGYKLDGTDKLLDIKNLSTGLKTFAILKTLLQNGVLQDKSVVILDEPEIHLHPQWQLVFAEIIVLLYKEFHINVLINTHSPYFLQAIESYSAKHKIADKCKYYLAHLVDNASSIDDVTESPEEIYKLLAEPLQELEKVRFTND